jgi:hypothetical protein
MEMLHTVTTTFDFLIRLQVAVVLDDSLERKSSGDDRLEETIAEPAELPAF